jgi:hypothetical protein
MKTGGGEGRAPEYSEGAHRVAEIGGASYIKREGGANKSNIINNAGIGAVERMGGAHPKKGT